MRAIRRLRPPLFRLPETPSQGTVLISRNPQYPAFHLRDGTFGRGKLRLQKPSQGAASISR